MISASVGGFDFGIAKMLRVESVGVATLEIGKTRLSYDWLLSQLRFGKLDVELHDSSGR
jgi:hypothetical protein